MANQLWSNLLIGTGRLWGNLGSAPGIVTPNAALLTLAGKVPVAVEPATVFRTPAPAVLTLSGLSVAPRLRLSPAPAALTFAGLVPGKVTSITITPALLSPDYSTPPSNPPTLITQMTVQPAVASLSIQVLPFNLTQGGNIGTVSPTPAQLSFDSLAYALRFGEPPGVGQLTIIGLVPDLQYELTITPDAGLMVMGQLAPELALPFTWVDDDPAPARTWITDAAA